MAHTGSPTVTEATSDRVGTSHNSDKGRRSLIGAVALINTVLFCLVLALDAYFFNSAANGKAEFGAILGGKAGTSSLLLMVVTFFSAIVGAASCLMALYYCKLYNEASRVVAVATALFGFGLAVLAFGFAIKALDQGSSGTKAENILITIAAIDILMVVMTAVLLLLTLVGKSRDYFYGSNYSTAGTGALPTHHKTVAGHSDARAMAA